MSGLKYRSGIWYIEKQHRGVRLHESTKTGDRKQAEKILRKRLAEIDDQLVFGKRPDRSFEQAAVKYLETDPKASGYVQHLDSLMPFIGRVPIRAISKDTLRGWIEHRYSQGVSSRTVDFGLIVVRRILRLATYYWRDNGLSWLDNCPIIPLESGDTKKPYPLTWVEQEKLLSLLPELHRRACLFAVNTGCRENVVLSLDWSMEKEVEGFPETVFHVPGSMTKNGKDQVIVLNTIARRALGERKEGKIFPFYQLSNKTWRKAWKEAGLPTDKNVLKGVHNLRHTFAKRLRDAEISERDIADLMHHIPKNITRHYSTPELKNLRAAVEKIVKKPELRLVV